MINASDHKETQQSRGGLAPGFAAPSQSVPRVRSLQRGLDVLRHLNNRNGVTLTQMTQASGLPRGTTYRILNTLIASGFVRRQEPEGRYYLTAKVTALSNGFDRESWPTEIGKPLMISLGEKIGWPVVLVTLFGTQMVVRENTDSLTSMVYNVVRPGYSMPVFSSASGWVYLAYCRPEEREALLANIADEDRDAMRYLAISPNDIARMLGRIKAQGHCVLPQRAIKSTVASVPILSSTGVFLAALSVRFFASAMTPQQAADDLVPAMTNCAESIADAYARWPQS